MGRGLHTVLLCASLRHASVGSREQVQPPLPPPRRRPFPGGGGGVPSAPGGRRAAPVAPQLGGMQGGGAGGAAPPPALEQDSQVLVGEGPCLPLSRGSAFIPHGGRNLGHEPGQLLVAALRPCVQPHHPVGQVRGQLCDAGCLFGCWVAFRGSVSPP